MEVLPTRGGGTSSEKSKPRATGGHKANGSLWDGRAAGEEKTKFGGCK